jgi:hypothetical protein
VSRGQVRTYAPDWSDRRYLGAVGPVTGLTYAYTTPGGCSEMSCTVQVRPGTLVQALRPGRYVEVVLGGSVVWDGKLDKPTPSAAGWSVTAHGSGTWGAEFCAAYTGAWGAAAFDSAVNAAIAAGLSWVNPGISGVPGLWAGQPRDSGMMMIDELLNQGCGHGGLTWYVRPGAGGRVLRLVPLPTTPTRLLTCADPVAPSLEASVNRIRIRYQSAPDMTPAGSPAVYSLTYVTDAAGLARWGPIEAPLDLSSAGVMAAADAQAVGSNILRRYQSGALAGTFTARPGQLLTAAGQPADLGVFWLASEGAMVVKLLLTDQGYGGEAGPGPVSFLVGQYRVSEDDQSAELTPFASLRQDFAGYLADRAAAARGRKVVIVKHGRRVTVTRHHKKVTEWRPTWHFKD